MYLGPLVFSETFKPKPWGGRALARVAGKTLPPGIPIGECWELADHPHGMSMVREGPAAEKSLRELMRRHSVNLLGRSAGKGRFPLLVKLLDAKRKLSVQVHPDDACAQAMRLKDAGKTEAWYVLHAANSASIIAGLKSKRDIARLRELARTGELSARLRTLHPHAGQALLCPAGAVHALGPGVALLEIQQTSDSTFRLYDWGRAGLDGKPRKLHLDEALRAIGNSVKSVRQTKPARLRGMPFPAERLVACARFVIDRWHVRRPVVRAGRKKFEILHVVAGSGRALDELWPPVKLSKGATVLIPACVAKYRIVPSRRLTIVRVAEPAGAGRMERLRHGT